ncbi:MAG: cadherin-like beta sandwich domain-containing protein [Oscillospiraceae bacterium]
MKILKKAALCLLTICAMLACMTQACLASGITVSAGQSTVSVDRTVAFTITVPSDAEVWLYRVEYSSNLTWVSGQTTVEGYSFDPGTRVNQLVFRANSPGTGTVNISAGSYAINGTNYDASGSASVTIVAADKPDDSEPAPAPTPSGGGSSTGNNPGVSLSSNNALSSLTVSAGTLTPAFDPAITEYTLSLPSQSDRLTITANPSDSRATVQGDGDISLQDGETSLSVVVTAEDGSPKTYTITVQVAQAPTLFLDYNGQRLGVVKDVSQVTPPAGFAPAEPITYSGDTLPIWTDVSGKRTLVYLMDEKTSAQGFYLFSQTTGVQSPYLPILCGSVTYIYTDIPKELSSVPGLTPATVKAFGQTLNGWTYNDASLKDFCVLYLMDDAGSYGYYTYDSREETLQRFSGAVFTDDAGQSLRVPMLYVYIAGGAALVLLILLIVFASVAGSRGRKLRLLPDTGASQPAADEGTPEATPDATPADDTAPELEQLPVASPQEDPSLSADVPVSPAGTLPRSLRTGAGG